MATKTLCRLCSFTCNDFKCLFDDNGQTSAVYEVAVKYFHPSLLDSGTDTTLKVICLECWQHISNFHNFQEWILNAQAQQDDLELIIYDEKPDDQMTTFDIDFDLKDDASTKSTNSTKSILPSLDSIEDKEENDVFIAKLKGQLECYKCKELFSSFIKLKSHFQQLHPTEQSCVICCEEKFNERWNLVEHLIVFHNQKDENPFKCETCGASFSQYGNLRRHMRKKHKVQPLLKWICKYCKKMFKIRSHLERHKHKMHKTQLNNGLEQAHSIDKHEKKEYVENYDIESESKEGSKMDSTYEYKSNELTCNKKNDNNIKIHIKEETMELKLTPTSSLSTIQIHMPALDIVDIKKENSTDTESETGTNKLPKGIYSNEDNTDVEDEDDEDDFISKWRGNLDCPKCNKRVKSYAQLSEHFMSQHPEERCYINCCHITLNDRAIIAEHLRFHENPHAFECADCGKCFNNSRGLGSHKLQVHSDTRSAYHLHLCYCKRAKELQAQNKAKGQQIEYDTVVCCQRKRKILEDDALISEWKKELVCEICKATFSYYSLMRVHFYREHPGEKCYISCCQRKISRISDALDHIRFHLNPHAYRCKLCNITFSGRSSLRKHIRNAHVHAEPKHKWACDECDKTFEIRQILTRHKNVFHSKQV